jgi:hypothetical protein
MCNQNFKILPVVAQLEIVKVRKHTHTTNTYPMPSLPYLPTSGRNSCCMPRYDCTFLKQIKIIRNDCTESHPIIKCYSSTFPQTHSKWKLLFPFLTFHRATYSLGVSEVFLQLSPFQIVWPSLHPYPTPGSMSAWPPLPWSLCTNLHNIHFKLLMFLLVLRDVNLQRESCKGKII